MVEVTKERDHRAGSSKSSETCLCTRHFWTIIIGAVFFGLFLRSLNIESRPLHSDEGVNWNFLNDISRDGFFAYSHENYHGPLFFYLCYLARSLLGETIFSLRAVSIFLGAFLPLLLLPLRRTISDRTIVLSTLLLAVSPSMIYQSRYMIHEITLIFCSLALAVAVFKWLIDEDSCYASLAPILIALMAATKETWCITAGALFLAALILRTPRDSYELLMRHSPQIIFGSTMAVCITVGIFTGGLKAFRPLYEAFLAIPQWIGRGYKDTGHFKPFLYYLDLLWETEFYIAIAVCLAIIFALVSLFKVAKLRRSNERIFLAYLAIWGSLETLVYSVVKYKTAWCVINISLPAIIFFAALLAYLSKQRCFECGTFDLSEKVPSSSDDVSLAKIEHPIQAGGASNTETAIRYDQLKEHESKPYLLKFCSTVSIAIALCSGFYYALYFNISSLHSDEKPSLFPPKLGLPLPETQPFGVLNPYSYVQTSEGMTDTVKLIDSYKAKKPTAKILIAVSAYWPLPYYLNKYSGQLAYLQTDQIAQYANEYDVIIADKNNEWRSPDWSVFYFRLSDVQESYVYFKGGVTAPFTQ